MRQELHEAVAKYELPLRFFKAGLNLNVFGALAGAFSGKNSKKTEEDGSTLEENEQNASVSGESRPMFMAGRGGG